MQKTMAGLDALLGILPEPPASSQDAAGGNKAWRANTSGAAQEGGVGISPAALEKIAEAEKQRQAASSGGSGASEIEAQMQKIVDKARKLAEEQAAAKKAGDASGTTPSKDTSEQVDGW